MELAAWEINFIEAGALDPDAPAMRFNNAFGERHQSPAPPPWKRDLLVECLPSSPGW